MKWVFVVLVVAARSGHADPVAALSVDAATLSAELESLPEQLDEPTGLAVPVRHPALGLEKGDVVRTINGNVASIRRVLEVVYGGPVVHLEVLRGGRPVAIRLQVKLETTARHSLDRASFRDQLFMLDPKGPSSADVFAQATKGGAPSGVVLRFNWFWIAAIQDGDIIRKVDGAEIKTIEQLRNALDRPKDRNRIVIEVERLGQLVKVTLDIDDPKAVDPVSDEIAKIKKLSDTSYEIPRALVDAVGANPALARGRTVSIGRNGKPLGVRLFGIRPGSVLAKLGLASGDIVLSVNGMALTLPDPTLAVSRLLIDATAAKVEIERGGTPVTLVYKIK
jgi:S1-C subfamily serine protease